MLGTELAAAGRLAEAERHLRAAAPVDPPARYYLGSVLANQGQHAEAIDQLQSSIDSQPEVLDQVQVARALLARWLMKQERIEESAVQYRMMIAADPDDLQAMVQLAQIHLRRQQFEEAIPLFRQVLSARPADPATLGGLGIALASSGRLDEAIEARGDSRLQADAAPTNGAARRARTHHVVPELINQARAGHAATTTAQRVTKRSCTTQAPRCFCVSNLPSPGPPRRVVHGLERVHRGPCRARIFRRT